MAVPMRRPIDLTLGTNPQQRVRQVPPQTTQPIGGNSSFQMAPSFGMAPGNRALTPSPIQTPQPIGGNSLQQRPSFGGAPSSNRIQPMTPGASIGQAPRLGAAGPSFGTAPTGNSLQQQMPPQALLALARGNQTTQPAGPTFGTASPSMSPMSSPMSMPEAMGATAAFTPSNPGAIPTASASAGTGMTATPPTMPGNAQTIPGGSLPVIPAPGTTAPAAPAPNPAANSNAGSLGQAQPNTGRPMVTAQMPQGAQGGNSGSTLDSWLNNTGGLSPFQVSATPGDMSPFQSFIDQAYQAQTRNLDPQWQQADRDFAQQMVNQGLAPGTEAYDNARANFDRARTDAYTQANTAASQLGAQMQQQMFGQGLSQSQLLSQLLLGREASDTSRYGSRLGAEASIAGSNAAAGASQANAALAAQTAANQLGFQREQGDFSNLMSLLGLGMQNQGMNNAAAGQNNNALAQLFGMNSGLMGLIPQGGGSQIDVTGPYMQQYQGQWNNAMYNQQQQNANAQNALQAFLALYGGGG